MMTTTGSKINIRWCRRLEMEYQATIWWSGSASTRSGVVLQPAGQMQYEQEDGDGHILDGCGGGGDEWLQGVSKVQSALACHTLLLEYVFQTDSVPQAATPALWCPTMSPS